MGNNTDVPPQGIHLDLFKVLTVNVDVADAWVVEPVQQSKESRLSTTRRAAYSSGASARNFKGHALQQLVPTRIAKVNIVENYSTMRNMKRTRIRNILSCRIGEKLEKNWDTARVKRSELRLWRA